MVCDDESATPTSGDDASVTSSAEDYKVGYKRPPIEHQFKEGQKPPPRKKKRGPSQSPRKLLARLLAETRRARLGGKIVWRSAGELVVHKAFEVAERSPKIDRLLVELQFQAERAEERGDIMILDPLDGSPPKINGGDDFPGLERAYAALAKRLPESWAAGTVSLRISRDGRRD